MVVTEFSPKILLSDLFKECKDSGFDHFTSSQRYIVALGVAYGLYFLHAKKFVHKNLRPSKIWLDDKYHPYISLLDFNTESDYDEIDTKATYIAPELKENRSNYSESSDVFAYSKIFYQLFTNKDPSNLDDDDYFADMDSEMKKFIKRMETDPKNRLSFKQIIDNLTSKQIKKEFHIENENEIIDYINIFNSNPAKGSNLDADPKPKATRSEGNGNGTNSKNTSTEATKRRKTDSDSEKGEDTIPKPKSPNATNSKGSKGDPPTINDKKSEADSDSPEDHDTEESNLVSLYKENADKGDVKSMIKYADLQYEGIDGKVCYKEAALYYKKAADEKDNPEAMYKYGDMLRYGLGGKFDKEEALEYYKKAALKKCEPAKMRYKALLKRPDFF